MKLRWPTRYELTRGFLLAMAMAWLVETHFGDDFAAMTRSTIFFVGYLLAGLMKPAHLTPEGDEG